MPLGKRQLQELLYYMVLTRRLEEALVRLHREQELTTPLGLRTGLEAVSVGAAFVPLLAFGLLLLCTREKLMGAALKNRPLATVALATTLAFFVWAAVVRFGG